MGAVVGGSAVADLDSVGVGWEAGGGSPDEGAGSCGETAWVVVSSVGWPDGVKLETRVESKQVESNQPP